MSGSGGGPAASIANLNPPAGPGNQLAVTHGASSLLRLTPRAGEIADDLREIVPARTVSDEPAIRLLALTLARIEAANAWLDEHGLIRGKGEPQPLLRVLSTWENSAARLCDRLALTPTSRAALGLHLTQVRGAALSAHLADRYGDAA